MGQHKRFTDADDADDEDYNNTKTNTENVFATAPGQAALAPQHLGTTGGISKPPHGTMQGSARNSGRDDHRRGRKGTNKPLGARIRALDRLLRNRGSTLPPGALAEKRAELQTLRRLHAEHGRRERERRMAKKYHMIRFFERERLKRRLRAIDRRLGRERTDTKRGGGGSGDDGNNRSDGDGDGKRDRKKRLRSARQDGDNSEDDDDDDKKNSNEDNNDDESSDNSDGGEKNNDTDGDGDDEKGDDDNLQRDAASLQREREQIRRDLLYVERFPKDRKYVALFPKGGHDKRSLAEVASMRAEIEAVAKGLPPPTPTPAAAQSSPPAHPVSVSASKSKQREPVDEVASQPQPEEKRKRKRKRGERALLARDVGMLPVKPAMQAPALEEDDFFVSVGGDE